MDNAATPQTERADLLSTTSPSAPAAYEAPRVELVLDADTLKREVQYAGQITGMEEGPG